MSVADSLDGLRKILSDPSTQWGDLPPNTTGDLVAAVHGASGLMLVVQPADTDAFVVNVTKEATTVEAAALVLESLPSSIEGPRPYLEQLAPIIGEWEQLIYVYTGSKSARFKCFIDLESPIPTEPPTTQAKER